jgi:hypothetical protein
MLILGLSSSPNTREITRRLCAQLDPNSEPRVWSRPDTTHDGVGTFVNASTWIAEQTATHGRNRPCIIVDFIDPIKLVPTNLHAGSWESIVGSLILAFPQCQWAFGSVWLSKADVVLPDLFSNHTVERLWNLERNAEASFRLLREPLFDPTGLRQFVKTRMMNLEPTLFPNPLTNREELAAVIDDEVDYAFLNAYALYRIGFRCDSITRWKVMKELFNDNSKVKYSLSLEDLSLRFPDLGDPGVKLFDLTHRANACPRLSLSIDRPHPPERFIATSGGNEGWNRILEHNEHLIEQLGGQLLQKPLGGIAEIWRDLKRSRRAYSNRMLRQTLHFELSPLLYFDFNPLKERLPVLASGFYWPPGSSYSKSKSRGMPMRAHGSQGSLLLIAEVLIKAANKVIDDENAGVFEDISGALMATEALELLAGGGQTTACEALIAQQVLEVRAECKFIGVGYHTSGRDRLDDIRRSITHIARGFRIEERRLIELDTSLQVCNRIAKIYREYSQFDEDGEWSHYCRWLHDFHFFERMVKRYSRLAVAPIRTMIFLVKWLWRVIAGDESRQSATSGGFFFRLRRVLRSLNYWGIRRIFIPLIFVPLLILLQYKTFVIGSIRRFVIALMCWIILFATLHNLLSTVNLTLPSHLNSVIDVCATFINVNLPANATQLGKLLTVAIGCCGIIHLGLFMALVTSKMLRKT